MSQLAVESRLFEAIGRNEPIGPKKVILSLTDWCNLRCAHCWRMDKQENPNHYRDEELTFEELSTIFRDCKALGVEELDLTGGGEPFAHPRIMDILRMAKDMGFWVTLTNNGTILGEEMMRELIAMQLDDITFSLDGATEQVNDAIRGKGVHQKVVSTLKRLLQLKEELASAVPVTRLSFVITAANYHESADIVSLAADLGIEAVQFSTLLEWGSNRHLSMSKVASPAARFNVRIAAGRLLSGKPHPSAALQDALRTARESGVNTNLESILRHGFFTHKTPDFCYAPWEMLFINSRGEALACCILASFYENALGNIREMPLKELWHSEKMRAFRERLGLGKYFRGCERCLPDFVDRFDGMEERRQGVAPVTEVMR